MNPENIHHNIVYEPPSLFKKVLHGGFWVFFLNLLNRSFTFVRTLIIARLLIPSDFGIFGISVLALHIVQTVTITGFDAALIQMKDDTRRYLDSAWVIQVLRGLLLALILLFGASFISQFFKEISVTPLIRVLGIAVLIESFKNIGIVYFLKDLEFKKQFIFRFSGTVADFIVAVVFGYLLRSVWALIFGLLARNLTQTIISYFIHPYRPKWKIDFKKCWELFKFGKWVLGNNLLTFIHNEGDDIFMGKLLGATALGFYQMAYKISNLPASEITNTISQVTFPAYSKLQDLGSRLRRAYLQILQLTSFLSIPISGLIIFFAEDFTVLLLKEEWLPMVPAIKILAIWGLIRSIGANSGPLFKAVGKPYLITRILIAKVILLALLIYPLTRYYGMIGTSWAVVISSVLIFPVTNYLVIKVSRCQVKDIVKILGIPLLITLIMFTILYLSKTLLLTETCILNFVLLIFIGLGFYLGIYISISRFMGFDIFKNTLDFFNKNK